MKKFDYAFLSFAQKVQQVCEDSRGFTRYICVRLNVCVIIADFSATNIQSAIRLRICFLIILPMFYIYYVLQIKTLLTNKCSSGCVKKEQGIRTNDGYV